MPTLVGAVERIPSATLDMLEEECANSQHDENERQVLSAQRDPDVHSVASSNSHRSGRAGEEGESETESGFQRLLAERLSSAQRALASSHAEILETVARQLRSAGQLHRDDGNAVTEGYATANYDGLSTASSGAQPHAKASSKEPLAEFLSLPGGQQGSRRVSRTSSDCKINGLVPVVPSALGEDLPTYRDKARKTKSSGRGFQLLPIWARNASSVEFVRVTATRKAVDDCFEDDTVDTAADRQYVIPDHMWARVPTVNPQSFSRGLWDLVSVGLVIYDAIMIPLGFFELPEELWMVVCTWFARIFWTLDVLASFTSGYIASDGQVEMRPKQIARRYVRTWFLLDICIVCTDWIELGLPDQGLGYARVGKASRVIRILRLLRLLRIMRVQQIVGMFTERLQSERLMIASNLLKIVTVIAGLGHLMACIWYGIAAGSDRQDTWLSQDNYANRSIEARYTMALHWSVSQFTGGMDEVTPENVQERIYAICVYFMTFVLASMFVSSITSSMTQLLLLSNHRTHNMSILRRYLAQNCISKVLAMRVQRNAQYMLAEQQRQMPESSVELLGKISKPLRIELHSEVYGPMLSMHPFFLEMHCRCPAVVQKICHHATTIEEISSGDVIFHAKQVPLQPKMYIVVSGTFKYFHTHGGSEVAEEGLWISEAVLWTVWMHCGEFIGKGVGRLGIIDARRFQEVALQFPTLRPDPKVYGLGFVNTLNGLSADALTDLPCGTSKFEVPRDLSGQHRGSMLKSLEEQLRNMVRRSTFSRKSVQDQPEDG